MYRSKRSNEGQGGPKEIVEGRPSAKENRSVNTRAGHRAGFRGSTHGWEVRCELYVSERFFEVGTVCVSSASTVLCGGRRATGVRTATHALRATKDDEGATTRFECFRRSFAASSTESQHGPSGHRRE